ncbi:MAG: transporter [Turneriella sp.]|nr:transporter [Turneriella sp.]
MSLLAFLILSPFTWIGAQYHPSIRTGRPGQAIGPYTTGQGVLQFQQGVEFARQNTGGGKTSGVLSNNVVRYGILETFEISGVADYQFQSEETNLFSRDTQGISAVHAGVRSHISDQKGFLPTTGLQVRLKFPRVSAAFGSSQISPVLVFVTNWSLPKDLSFAINWIYSQNGNDAVPTGAYVINFGFPIWGDLRGFVENYGQRRGEMFETRFDGGFAYLWTNDLQLDIFAGAGKNGGTTDYFINTGVSWRLNFRG